MIECQYRGISDEKNITIGGSKMSLNYDLLRSHIKTLRLEKELSQEDLAEFADLSVPYISHIETGRKKPSLESLVKIADVLGVSVDQLLRGNQKYDSHPYERDIAELLGKCSRTERRIILAVVSSLVRCFRDLRSNQ